MTIMELGALGEFVGAIAVVATLIYLTIQVRQSREAMEENARLERTNAMGRQSDVVSRWRGRLIEDAEVADLWRKAQEGSDVDEITAIRRESLIIDWFNTYRSYFVHADAVGHDGLAEQAVVSLALPLVRSASLRSYWEASRVMHDFAAPEFVIAVDAAITAIAARSE